MSAMEGVGVAEAIERYHGLASTLRRVPYTNIRTASNLIHHPVAQVCAAGGGRVCVCG